MAKKKKNNYYWMVYLSYQDGKQSLYACADRGENPFIIAEEMFKCTNPPEYYTQLFNWKKITKEEYNLWVKYNP